MNEISVVVDCRWLGYSGVGKVTELFLEGLAELRPAGDWTLWGRPDLESYLWPGARIVAAESSPTQLAAQRSAFSVPPGDVVLWMHAVRPLVSRRSVQFVHDLIPVHFAANAVLRRAWGLFFARSCSTATRIVVNSRATSDQLKNELGVRVDEIIPCPIDGDRALQIRTLREQAERQGSRGGPPRMLYVGQVKPHKNLPRAVEAYFASGFCERGGVFTILAGGATDSKELSDIRALTASNRPGRVEIRPRCTDEELDELFASASFLIQPSLEEGFGLPVAEALAAGVPVCCSDIPALREAAQGQARFFEPTSVSSMTRAIDETAADADRGAIPETPRSTSVVEFATRLVDQVVRTGQAASASE